MKDSMVTGAVAVLDVLGFKGIWRRSDPDRVIRKLRMVKVRARHGPLDLDSYFPVRTHNRVRFLSDTIVVAVSAAPTSSTADQAQRDMLDASALQAVCNRVQAVCWVMLLQEGDPPLALRGSIAWGDFLIKSNFMVGPAIDEAASNERLAEAAVTWLSPSALRRLEELERMRHASGTTGLLHRTPLTRWSVPLKGGRRYHTAAVPVGVEVERLVAATTRAFRLDEPQPLDVGVKFQNTEAFLRNQRAGAVITGGGWFALQDGEQREEEIA